MDVCSLYVPILPHNSIKDMVEKVQGQNHNKEEVMCKCISVTL